MILSLFFKPFWAVSLIGFFLGNGIAQATPQKKGISGPLKSPSMKTVTNQKRVSKKSSPLLHVHEIPSDSSPPVKGVAPVVLSTEEKTFLSHDFWEGHQVRLGFGPFFVVNALNTSEYTDSTARTGVRVGLMQDFGYEYGWVFKKNYYFSLDSTWTIFEGDSFRDQTVTLFKVRVPAVLLIAIPILHLNAGYITENNLLLLPVVDDAKQASIALKWAVNEMERRYRILAKIGARNLASFNQKIDEMGSAVVRDLLFSEDNQGETPTVSSSGSDWIEAFELDDQGAPRVSKLPYIVIVIDELADLMMIAKKEVEISIARIAQKARAAGIHLIIATQRPSTDVITGLIKANLPSRVSFQLASYVDSKTILDRAGAERLLGQGDMLFIPPGVSQSIRLHGAYLEDDEIEKITHFLKAQGKPVYRDEILLAEEDEGEEEEDFADSDELFQEAVLLVKRSGHASASFLQRHLKIGYNRAARMIEAMEMKGIVGPQEGARAREVLIS